MGQKQSKLTSEASQVAAQLVDRLSPLGDISSRAMFGGVGIFASGAMFALVTADGIPHLKVADSNRARFEQANAAKFGRMPYYEIPANVLTNTRTLRSWAKLSMQIAKAAK